MNYEKPNYQKLRGKVIAIIGPTATGKTDLSIALAKRINAELGVVRKAEGGGASEQAGASIINADAFQLYKYMDIGTAKVDINSRKAIKHYQIDVLEPEENAFVATYQKKARRDLSAVLERGGVPIVVGGSGLYVRALLDKIDFPETNPEIRASLEARADEEGVSALFAELESADPVSAKNIGPYNTRRIIRALEVIKTSGKPFFGTLPKNEYYLENTVQIGLKVDNDCADRLIEKRTKLMREQGLLEEVVSLYSRLGVTARKAIGYKEILEYLDGKTSKSGIAGLDEAFENIALHTRQLVRKQYAWFKRDNRITWLNPMQHDDMLSDVLKLVL